MHHFTCILHHFNCNLNSSSCTIICTIYWFSNNISKDKKVFICNLLCSMHMYLSMHVYFKFIGNIGYWLFFSYFATCILLNVICIIIHAIFMILHYSMYFWLLLCHTKNMKKNKKWFIKNKNILSWIKHSV